MIEGELKKPLRKVLLRQLPRLGPANPTVASILANSKLFAQQTVAKACVDEDELQALLADPSIEVHPDVYLRPCELGGAWTPIMEPAVIGEPGLQTVLDMISAPAAWHFSRGDGAIIAIVDTGVCGSAPEFPLFKRAGGWSFDGSDPWVDYLGHGTMSAVIAAGTHSIGGIGSGVAPGSRLLSCKTSFLTSELIEIYEWLIAQKERLQSPLVINNSFAFTTALAPAENGQAISPSHPFVTSVGQAIDAGIFVVFAAGNNNAFFKNDGSCSRNSIWIWNSLDSVMTVGAVDNNLSPWYYSSRGPGQWSVAQQKPDCVAPVFGNTMWGGQYVNMREGWGTSGAAPQVTGLAALILSLKPSLLPHEVADIIRNSCDHLNYSDTCAGDGIINCVNALATFSS